MASFNAEYTPLEEIPKLRTELRDSFASGLTLPPAFRIQQLRQLARMCQENKDAIAEAVAQDLAKPKIEVFSAEVGPVIERSLYAAERLHEWTRPEKIEVNTPWQKEWDTRLYRLPKGVVLVIAPWNYPVILSLQPLGGAIAAGCCVVLKLSEVAPHYASLLTRLLPQYLDSRAYRIVNGAVPEVTKVLELQWDHIFYTGHGAIARIVSAAAAKHLTPLTLELGGKSPVIIDPASDLTLAARRVLYGKFNNAGQICVCPDYVLIPASAKPAFIAALQDAYKEWFPNGCLESDDFGSIVNPTHHARLKGLLDRTKGRIVMGGRVGDDKKGRMVRMELTVVDGVGQEDALMEGEIFGPILPILEVRDVDEAIEFVRARPHPLVLYAFTQDDDVRRKVLLRTTSGNLVFNDTFMQLSGDLFDYILHVNELPFGGVGESGYGRQAQKWSFDIFSYERSYVDIPPRMEPGLSHRYPPYDGRAMAIMSAATNMKIPKDDVSGGGVEGLF
ncbi:aldehyde dehydrogenase [Schizophyllum amplum]|uniref:Aldehyde dehydrogenase n=1 Tax=Schizophyllum amplum TaxID=97359 RepID=A0A550BYL6_9AGAR|nr:aldehyde dehydrogenase [Auriculariopsis ampla]